MSTHVLHGTVSNSFDMYCVPQLCTPGDNQLNIWELGQPPLPLFCALLPVLAPVGNASSLFPPKTLVSFGFKKNWLENCQSSFSLMLGCASPLRTITNRGYWVTLSDSKCSTSKYRDSINVWTTLETPLMPTLWNRGGKPIGATSHTHHMR